MHLGVGTWRGPAPRETLAGPGVPWTCPVWRGPAWCGADGLVQRGRPGAARTARCHTAWPGVACVALVERACGTVTWRRQLATGHSPCVTRLGLGGAPGRAASSSESYGGQQADPILAGPADEPDPGPAGHTRRVVRVTRRAGASTGADTGYGCHRPAGPGEPTPDLPMDPFSKVQINGVELGLFNGGPSGQPDPSGPVRTSAEAGASGASAPNPWTAQLVRVARVARVRSSLPVG